MAVDPSGRTSRVEQLTITHGDLASYGFRFGLAPIYELYSKHTYRLLYMGEYSLGSDIRPIMAALWWVPSLLHIVVTIAPLGGLPVPDSVFESYQVTCTGHGHPLLRRPFFTDNLPVLLAELGMFADAQYDLSPAIAVELADIQFVSAT